LIATLAVAGASLLASSGCSGGAAGLPGAVAPQSGSPSANGVRVPKASGTALPISVGAFPVSVAAFPVSVAAFPVCQTQADVQSAQCTGQLRSDIKPNPNATMSPLLMTGYLPADLQSAYGLTSLAQTNGGGATIAVVVAYDTPLLELDLNVYRAAFGMAPCTQLNGCLTINQVTPGAQLPVSLPWQTEASLDVEMISAVCPLCKISVVEANSANIADLAAAVDYAAQHATVINNSFAIPESGGALAFESHWNHPGIPILAGAGDGGYAWGVSFPASSRYVTAVGGTNLARSPGGAFASTVWPLSGSGCSAYVPKPTWQHDTGCSTRTLNDVSAVGDPATGVEAFVTVSGGWTIFGGTSVATPIVSAEYVLTGNMSAGPSLFYSQPQSLQPVLSGSNGTCTPAYLCTAGPGYNGPGGLGSPFL
jgi:subtilase family serine protease